jgi:hypothetical protein
LNLNFLRAGWRLPSTCVEGALCALSATPIPPEYRHGASIPVGLKFFGRSGQQLAATNVVLWAERWREPAVTRPIAQPAVVVELAEPRVAARSFRSRLYDQGERNDLRAAPPAPEGRGSPPATRVREDSPRAGVRGE